MANSGPVNAPTTINNFGDYDRIFGGLWARSTMSFAVNDFFANGGSQAIIVRLVATDAAASGFEPAVAATVSLPEDLTASPPSNLSSTSPTHRSRSCRRRTLGSWGDYVNVVIDQKTKKTPSDPTLFNLTATQMNPDADSGTRVGEVSEPFRRSRESQLCAHRARAEFRAARGRAG